MFHFTRESNGALTQPVLPNCRSGGYADGVARAKAMLGKGEIAAIHREEFRAMADSFLGSKCDRKKLDAVEQPNIALDRRQAQSARFEAGKIPPESCADEFNGILSETFTHCEKIPGACDFLPLFGVPLKEAAGFIGRRRFLP